MAAIHADLEIKIKAEEKLHASGSLGAVATQKLEVLLANLRDLSNRMSTLTPQNAAELAHEGAMRMPEVQKAGRDAAALLQEAGIDYDRNLSKIVFDSKIKLK